MHVSSWQHACGTFIGDTPVIVLRSDCKGVLLLLLLVVVVPGYCDQAGLPEQEDAGQGQA
jgi:hypothetical protein